VDVLSIVVTNFDPNTTIRVAAHGKPPQETFSFRLSQRTCAAGSSDGSPETRSFSDWESVLWDTLLDWLARPPMIAA
jgi:hypothetical protein